jgi:hypothetical protein
VTCDISATLNHPGELTVKVNREGIANWYGE